MAIGELQHEYDQADLQGVDFANVVCAVCDGNDMSLLRDRDAGSLELC